MPGNPRHDNGPGNGVVSHLEGVFFETLGHCSTTFQLECIRRTGTLTVPYVRLQRRPFQGPEMMPPDTIPNLTYLPQYLYGQTTYSPAELLGLWDQTAACILDRKPASRVRRLVRSAFPALPLVDSDDGRTEALQLLCAVSWHSGSFEVRRQQALLHVNHLTVGFDGRWVLTTDGSRPRRRGSSKLPLWVLAAYLGTPRMATGAIGALHEFLLQQLSDLSREINTAFNAAVQAGPTYCKVLSSMFDVVFSEGQEDLSKQVGNVWGKSRVLIRNPVGNPLPELSRLLIPRIGSRTFQKLFGNPYRQRSNINEATRQRLLKLVDRLESQSIVSAGGEAPGRQSQSVRSLIELHEIVGRVTA